MKKLRILIPVLIVLLGVTLVCAFLAYGIWTTNMAFDEMVPFPEGTQIIRKTDTHQGVFRRKGTAVAVVRIPENSIQTYADRLRMCDFSEGQPMGLAPELLADIEETADILEAPNTLYTFRDGALALVEEPFSEWFAAIYDLDSGLFCYIEYDE